MKTSTAACRALSCCFAAILLIFSFQGAVQAASASTPGAPKRTSITGTIALYGCAAAASQVKVVAFPVMIATPERLRPKRTRALRTARPIRARTSISAQILSELRFAIPNLNDGVIYKLSVGIDEPICGKM
ncbi:MAG: hypothetical protein DCC75_07855, partial [Proteobacteria bacterium]